MSILYAIYAFVIGIVDVKSGMRLLNEHKGGWNQLVGGSALLIGVVAFIAGFQALFGFYVDPLMLLLPLVFAGFVIMIESWKDVKTGNWGSILIAVYNSFAWITNVIRLVYILGGRRRD